MAIAGMRKIQILVHRDVQERVMKRIQEIERLQITDVKESVTAEHHPDLVSGIEVSDEGPERRLSRIESTLDFLSSVQEKKGFLSGLIPPKIILSPEQYQSIVEEYDEDTTVSRCRELDQERTELVSAVTKLEGIIEQLRPWLALDCPLVGIGSTEHVAIFLGTLTLEALGDFSEKSSEMTEQMVVETVSQDREKAYLLICVHKEISPQVSELLKRLGFEKAGLPELSGKPQDEYEQALKQIDENLQRIHEIEDHSKEYLKDRQNLQILHDHLYGQLQCARIEAKLGQTEKACVIEGWIPQSELRTFEATLKKEFDHLAIIPLDPSAREIPPIALENSQTFVRPFEVVTELYGMPNSREYDPSPLLAPFFFVFFGLCITDAAYGVIITLLFLYLMRRFKVTLGRAKLVGLLFFGGISTILMGAMTGGWFGDLASYLPPWLDGVRRMRLSLMLFDPMEQVLVFITIREGNLVDAFCGPFPWLTLLNGLVFFGLSKGDVFSPFVGGLGKWVAILSALAIVLLTDRSSSSWFARIAWGVYGLYGITSYVGDVLSYLRLFALGLATGIIAMVVNLLADMLRGAPYVGWLLFAIIFVMGHMFNILINGLGAFVHTLRLQYVEFFPKFFEGGGRPYQPFRKEARYTIIAEKGQR